MKTFAINVKIDRPGTGMDVILNQPETDLTTENVQNAQQVLGANFGNMDGIPAGSVIEVDAVLKNDGTPILTIIGSFSKEDIQEFELVMNPQSTEN